MHIDAHQHFWKYDRNQYEWIDDALAMLRRDFLPHDLEPELRTNGFSGSIAVQARQSLEETRWLLELAAASPSILGVVGWVDLRSLDVRGQLAAFAENPKLVGIRHVVQSEPDPEFLLLPDFLRGISLLEEFDLAYDILIYAQHLRVAEEFVSRFPRQRFVLDHMAKPPIKGGAIEEWAREIRKLAEHANVSCKVSGLVTEADWQNWTPEQVAPYLDVVFDCFGAGRLMIGSDWPVCLAAASYSRTMTFVKEYLRRYSAQAQELVLGENARRFWRLAGSDGSKRIPRA